MPSTSLRSMKYVSVRPPTKYESRKPLSATKTSAVAAHAAYTHIACRPSTFEKSTCGHESTPSMLRPQSKPFPRICCALGDASACDAHDAPQQTACRVPASSAPANWPITADTPLTTVTENR